MMPAIEILLTGVMFFIYKIIGGSRVKLKEKPEPNRNKMDRDDDKYWIAGIIYYNPEDPAIFLEKRFGIGWTFNFGNKTAILICLALIILLTVTPFFISLMGR